MSTYKPLRVRARYALKRLLPSPFFALVHRLWIQWFSHFFKVEDILQHYTEEFHANNPRVVQGGLFAGMHYVERAVGSNYLHKLIGSYESVLHPVIERLGTKYFDTIIDIGCAEGFYLVGLGRKFPQTRLVGFEIESVGRELVREMYKKNDLQNELILNGEASAENVTAYLTTNTLLICDCEGAELHILDPDIAPALLGVAVAIIELHDFITPGIKEALITRFKDTHEITIIPFTMAKSEDFPFLASITNANHLYELRRERGWQEQEWMVLEKKDHKQN
ncbi:hypothetical protein H6789_03005 [Candidatus Nomurabacteria bacterium]|nr:hypothetical protein [Candidatus Nomurabacteria bacterium]